MPNTKKFLDAAGTGYLWTKIVTELNKKADSSSLANVATSGTAADVAIVDSGSLITATNVEAALQEIVTNLNNSNTNNAVTVEKTAGGTNDSYVYRYTFKQGGTALTNGVIDIAKDMVATSGTLVHPTAQNPITIGGESITSGAYIQMTIANGDPFYINVADLIEYNEFTDSTEIDFTVNNHNVSAAIGDITGTKITYIAADAQNSIARESVTEALTRLDGNDSTTGSVAKKIKDAIAALDATVSASGTAANGGVFVVSGITETDGKLTAVTSTEVDAAGSATAVYDAIIALTNAEIDTAIASAT